MALTRVQLVTRFTTTAATSLAVPITTPVAGNLLVITHYAGGANQNVGMSGPAGFTTASQTTDTTAGGFAVYYRVSDGGEGTSLTVNSNSATGNVYNAATVTEWKAESPFISPLDRADPATSAGNSVTSLTLTLGATTGQANEIVIAAFGTTGSVSAWNNTWTNGFAQQVATSDFRYTLAQKETTAVETSSTAEAWSTARTVRGAIAAFRIPAPPPPTPTGLTATAVSSSQIDLAWNSATGATGYDLERDGQIIVTGQTGTTYSDTGRAAATTYSYRVRSRA